MRHFLWRAAKDSLPTKQNLRLQHIQIDDTCDGCSDQSESLMHYLWLCDQARSAWLSNPGFFFLTRRIVGPLWRFWRLFSARFGFWCALFAMIAWCLWERRNRIRECQRTWQLYEVGDRPKELVQEFWDVHYKETPIHACQSLVRWSPPSAACYKVNFDATILEGTNRVGIGVVCKDCEGNV